MQSNPLARWHICQGSINGIAFSADGVFLATVGRDGIKCWIILYLLWEESEKYICGTAGRIP